MLTLNSIAHQIVLVSLKYIFASPHSLQGTMETCFICTKCHLKIKYYQANNHLSFEAYSATKIITRANSCLNLLLTLPLFLPSHIQRISKFPFLKVHFPSSLQKATKHTLIYLNTRHCTYTSIPKALEMCTSTVKIFENCLQVFNSFK